MSKTSKTFATSFRGDVIDLAVLARWFIKQGMIPRSRNELIASAVASFTILIVRNNPELAVNSLEDAYGVIENLGLVGVNRAKVFPNEKLEQWEVENSDLNLVPDFEPELTEKANKAEQATIAGQLGSLQELLARRKQQDETVNRALSNTENLPIED